MLTPQTEHTIHLTMAQAPLQDGVLVIVHDPVGSRWSDAAHRLGGLELRRAQSGIGP
jgi:hypothetical protein